MAKIQSVKFNFVMNSILTMSAMIFPIITYPYVTGILGPQGIGTVSFANSVVTYFSMFAQLGIPTYGIRACAKVRDNREELSRVTQEILLINLVTCVVSYVLFFISLQAIPQLREEKGLYLVMSSMILFNSIGAEWLYKGLEQYRYITLRSVLFKFIALVGMFLLIHEEGDYVIYGGITIFASVGSNLLNLINLKWLVDVRPMGHYNFRRHLRPIFVFFAMSIATTVYTNMDNVMLGFLRGTTENGYYDAAVKIKNILVSVVASLGTVLLPRVSYYVERGEKEAFAQATQKALRFVFLLAMPLCLYFILFARPSIYLLSGKAFEASILPMQLIMPTLVFIGLTNIMGIQILVPTGREKQVLFSEIVGAVVNVVANSLLIPQMGAAGAAIGTVLAELAVLVVQIVALGREILPALAGLPYLKTGVALAAAMASVWWLLGSSLLPRPQPASPQEITTLAPLPTFTYVPPRRTDLAQLTALRVFVDGLSAEEEKTAAIVASSFTFNSSIYDAIYRSTGIPEPEGPATAIIPFATVDKRDSFSWNALTADYLVVADPVQYHLGEDNQHLVTVLAQPVLEGTGVGTAYTRLDLSFPLQNGVTVYVYQRTRPVTGDEFRAISAQLTALYPDYAHQYRWPA